MNAKRFISLMLCALMLLSSGLLVGCKDEEDVSDVASATGDWIEDLAEFKWEGEAYKTFRILISDNKADTTYFAEDVVPDLYSTTDTNLNEAVKTRNEELMSRYGVEIKATPTDNLPQALERDRAANQNSYDAAMPFVYNAITLAQNGIFYNLYDSIFDGYIHLDEPWWDAKASSALSVGNALYFATGDISILPKVVSVAVAFNKDMLKDYGEGIDLYETVRKGEWTFDLMYELAKKATVDNDGKAGLTYEDQWGLSAAYGDVNAYLISAGQHYVDKDANDLPFLALGDQTSVNVASTVLGKLQEPGWVWMCDTIVDGTKWEKSLAVFGEGRALFRNSAFSAIKKLRAYDGVDFGIIPFPRVTDTQESYHTPCNISTGFVVAILSSLDTERAQFAAYMLDGMAYGGKKHITPAYYDTTLKYRDLRDNESEEMLDEYIFNNIVYDLGWACNFGGINDMMYSLMQAKNPSIVSSLGAKKNSIESDIKKCIEAYQQYAK